MFSISELSLSVLLERLILLLYAVLKSELFDGLWAQAKGLSMMLMMLIILEGVLGEQDKLSFTSLEGVLGADDKGLSTLEGGVVLLWIISSENDDLWLLLAGDVGPDVSDLIGDVGGDVADAAEGVRVLVLSNLFGVASYCNKATCPGESYWNTSFCLLRGGEEKDARRELRMPSVWVVDVTRVGAAGGEVREWQAWQAWQGVMGVAGEERGR